MCLNHHGFSGPLLAKKAQGFSLLESLISILVLSFGVLGAVALQTAGVRASQEGFLHTQATQLAYAMVDHMQLNPVGIDQVFADGSTTDTGQANGSPCSPCTPTQRANNDFAFWKGLIEQGLPGGVGTIARNGALYTVSIEWDAEPGSTTAGTPQVSMEIRLQ